MLDLRTSLRMKFGTQNEAKSAKASVTPSVYNDVKYIEDDHPYRSNLIVIDPVKLFYTNLELHR